MVYIMSCWTVLSLNNLKKYNLEENTVVSEPFFRQTIIVNRGKGPETEIKPK